MFKGEFLFDDADRFCSDSVVGSLGKGSFGVGVFPLGFERSGGVGIVVVALCSWFLGSMLLLERP